MATLTVTTTSFSGATLSPTACAGGGDKFLNDGKTKFYIKNNSGGSITVTIDAQGTPGGLTITDPTVTVGSGVEKIVGPFDPQYFNDTSGYVNLTYSGVTSLTIAPFN